MKEKKPPKIVDARTRDDPDFIIAPRHLNSLKRLMDSGNGEIKIRTAAKALGLTEEEFEAAREEAILKLQEELPSSAR